MMKLSVKISLPPAYVLRLRNALFVFFVLEGERIWCPLKELEHSYVILDYGLPYMNGIELYDRLHSNKELAAIPAIMMTAIRHIPQEQMQQRHLITFKKPFELDALLATIETLLTSP